jgi:excinuclease UvrABC nuclease subunit
LLPRSKIDGLPMAPGIYRFFSEDGKLLYIGKAKNLRERVWSYTTNSAGHSNKTLDLIRHARDVRAEVLGSELEAALEEATAIRAQKPEYNILGKHLPQIAFIRIGLADDFPRLSISKRLTTGRSRFAGPFRNRKEAERTLALMTKLFRLRTCHGKLAPDPEFSPCFQGQIGACSEPCAARVSVTDYSAQVAQYLELLDGRADEIEARMTERREEQANAAQFESAARTQRDIQLLRRVARRQSRLGWIVRQRNFLVLQRAVGQPLVLAYAVIHGFLAVRARLVDESQIDALVDEIRRRMAQPRSEVRVDEAVDGTTILAAWLRDRQEDEGNVFAIEGDAIAENIVREWRAACAALLKEVSV